MSDVKWFSLVFSSCLTRHDIDVFQPIPTTDNYLLPVADTNNITNDSTFVHVE